MIIFFFLLTLISSGQTKKIMFRKQTQLVNRYIYVYETRSVGGKKQLFTYERKKKNIV